VPVRWIEAEEIISGGEVKRSCSAHKRKGRSELGLNPRHSALVPPNGDPTGPGRLGLQAMGQLALVIEPLRPTTSSGPAIKVVGRSKVGRHQEGLGHFYFYCYSVIFFFSNSD
jgi:hypothetical protein